MDSNNSNLRNKDESAVVSVSETAILVAGLAGGEWIGDMWVWTDADGNTWADDEIVAWAVVE